MGRTLPSITIQIDIERQALEPFRRGLRIADQKIFDQLFAAASFHRTSIGLAARALPMEAMLLAMLVEQAKKVDHQQVQIDQLMAQLLERSR